MAQGGVLLAVDAAHASVGFPPSLEEGRSSSVLGHQGWTTPRWQRRARAGRGPHRLPSLPPWAARATRPQTPWGAGAGGGLALFARLLRLLGRLQDPLAEEGKTGPPIALALHELQAVDLAFGDAVVPLEGEPRGDGAQVILQAPREASQCLNPTLGRLRHPGLQVAAPALPDYGEKGLGQLIGSATRVMLLRPS